MRPIFKHIFWNLTKDEIDLLNILINLVNKDIELNSEIFNYDCFEYIIDTNMHELSACLGFDKLMIDTIIQRLEALQLKPITLYQKLDSNIYMMKTNFIYQFNISSTNNDINKRLNIIINTHVLRILKENIYLLELFYKFDKFNIKSKYSKIVYEAFYKKDKYTEIFEIDKLIQKVDFGLKYSEMNWSRFNSNILKRVVSELNAKSDMKISIEKVKEVVEELNRVQTTKIKISIEMKSEENETYGLFTPAFLMQRKVNYYIERDINQKFNEIIKFKGKKIISNPEAYKHKLRIQAQKQYNEYKSKVLLQEWLNNIKYKNYEHKGLVVLENYTQNNLYVTVDNKYKLYDIEKKVEISSSAEDTRAKINAFLKTGEYNIIETNEYIKECSISYTEG